MYIPILREVKKLATIILYIDTVFTSSFITSRTGCLKESDSIS